MLLRDNGNRHHNTYRVRSTDPNQLLWEYVTPVALASSYPHSGEGPNENAMSLLADGRTLTIVFRTDNGDGNPDHPELAKNAAYYQTFSADHGKTWSVGKIMPGVGCARPRLLMLGGGGGGGSGDGAGGGVGGVGGGKGPLLLVSGRGGAADQTDYVGGGGGDTVLWVRNKTTLSL